MAFEITLHIPDRAMAKLSRLCPEAGPEETVEVAITAAALISDNILEEDGARFFTLIAPGARIISFELDPDTEVRTEPGKANLRLVSSAKP